jgi:hypothetical protein
MLSGTSPYQNGFEVVRNIYSVKARDILFRKNITYGGFGSGPPVYVEYRPVPTPEQTGKLELSSSSRIAGTFAGYQQGGTMPMVFDEASGSASIPLNGQQSGSSGSVLGAGEPFGSPYSNLRVYQLPATQEHPARCRVELRLEMSGTAYGKLFGIVPAKTLASIDLNCTYPGYSYTADLFGDLWYREIWEPINLGSFFNCPGEMHARPSSGTYYDQLGATESRVETGPCDDLDPVCCCANGCFPSSTGCIYKNVTTGLGRASIVGTNTP